MASGGIRWDGAGPAAAADALRHAADEVPEVVARVVRKIPDELKRTFPDAARRKMPRRGGLADIVAAADITAVEDVSGDRVEVIATATSGRVDLGPLNAGDLRHPTYGRGRWVRQRVPSGMWQEACDDARKGTDDELLQDLREVARTTAQRSRGS